jgi:methylmalonyl-CoA/ethylmalonyl-CoA epimerase
LLKSDTILFEFVEPLDELSPVTKLLNKTGVSPYHFCYETDDIATAIEELKKQKYVLIQKPVPATALDNRNVCFLYHKDGGLIELLEK